jgi:hypothetical protein
MVTVKDGCPTCKGSGYVEDPRGGTSYALCPRCNIDGLRSWRWTLAPRDRLAVPLQVALTLLGGGCPALADAQVRCYRRLRGRLMMPHERRALPDLDEAARPLAIAADLTLQGLADYAGPIAAHAARLLESGRAKLMSW